MAIFRASDFPRTRRTLGALHGDVFSSLGVTLFEWWNPDIVAREYEAVGKDPASAPQVTFGDVIGAAAEDTRDVVTGAAGEIMEGAEALAGGAQKVALGVGIAAVLAALVYFSQKRRK